MKTHLRDLARELRKNEGASINEIARRIGAAQSSVSRWVKDVELTDEQCETLRIRAYNGHVKGRTMTRALRREARVLAQEEGRHLAARAETLHVAGCMLYWAEGAKDRNQLQFSNTDPEMMRLFVRFLRTYFGLRDDEITVKCNLFADHVERQREIEGFWLDVLDLPRSSLRKSSVNVYSKYSKKTRCNKLPYGTCYVRVNRTRVVQSIFGAIQELGGFERPAWLE